MQDSFQQALNKSNFNSVFICTKLIYLMLFIAVLKFIVNPSLFPVAAAFGVLHLFIIYTFWLNSRTYPDLRQFTKDWVGTLFLGISTVNIVIVISQLNFTLSAFLTLLNQFVVISYIYFGRCISR